MINIQNIGQVEAPRLNNSSKDVSSPKGEWALRFHDANEFSYGSYGWQLSLFHKGIDVSSEHLDFLNLGKTKGLHRTSYDKPWLHNGNTIVVSNWHNVFIYNLIKKKKRCIANDGFPYLILCAPDRDLILLSKFSEAEVFNKNGDSKSRFNWKIHRDERPILFWIDSSRFIAHIGRSSRKSKTRLTLFSSETGKVYESVILHPDELVPYQREKYKKIDRNSASLEITKSSSAEGYLLDIWRVAVFNENTSTLYLKCYRPTSDIFRKMGTYMCKVKDIWIALKINFS